MLKWFVLLAAVACACAANSAEDGVRPGRRNPSCPCGWANRGTVRIVGGTFYKQNKYPFIAGLARVDPQGRGYAPFCGGSIITPNHVITAAHCTDDIIKQRTPIVALLGTHDRSKMDSRAQVIPVQGIRQHELYESRTVKNDISIVVLAQSINYNMVVGPVCLPLPGLDVTGRIVRVIGWGAQQFQGAMSLAPKELDTNVVTPASCAQQWGGMVSATRPTQVCTHSQRETACQGDSGGPVVYLDPETNRYTLIGLVSFGPSCTDAKPTVNTRVEAYLPWIQQQISFTKPAATCFKV